MLNIELTSNALFYLIKNLKDEIEGAYINNLQNIDYDTIKIKAHKKNSKELIITKNYFFISNYKLPVMTQSLAFIRYLKKKLNNQKIKEIKQHKNNRVFYMLLDDYYLIFEMFSNSNIILTDLNYKVLSAKRYEKWKDRKTIRNEKYDFPEAINIDEEFRCNKKEEKEIIKEITKKYKIHPFYLEKLNIKKNINEQINQLYTYEKPSLEILNKNDKKIIVIINNNKNNIFETLENFYLKEEYKKIETKTENVKQKKINKIIEEQTKKKMEFEENIIKIDKDVEFIYANYLVIEEINKQINIGLKKGIDKKEIILKINDYLKKKCDFKIKNIDLKLKKIIFEK